MGGGSYGGVVVMGSCSYVNGYELGKICYGHMFRLIVMYRCIINSGA